LLTEKDHDHHKAKEDSKKDGEPSLKAFTLKGAKISLQRTGNDKVTKLAYISAQ
jgi:hypothetical protein